MLTRSEFIFLITHFWLIREEVADLLTKSTSPCHKKRINKEDARLTCVEEQEQQQQKKGNWLLLSLLLLKPQPNARADSLCWLTLDSFWFLAGDWGGGGGGWQTITTAAAAYMHAKLRTRFMQRCPTFQRPVWSTTKYPPISVTGLSEGESAMPLPPDCGFTFAIYILNNLNI